MLMLRKTKVSPTFTYFCSPFNLFLFLYIARTDVPSGLYVNGSCCVLCWIKAHRDLDRFYCRFSIWAHNNTQQPFMCHLLSSDIQECVAQHGVLEETRKHLLFFKLLKLNACFSLALNPPFVMLIQSNSTNEDFCNLVRHPIVPPLGVYLNSQFHYNSIVA